MTALRAVLFDLDETLLDRAASLNAFVGWQAADVLRLGDQTDRFVRRFIELDRAGRVWKDEVYAALHEEFRLSGRSATELLADYVRDFPRFARPRRGAEFSVHALAARGLRLGVVSNGRSPFQERVFAALDLHRRFATVVVSGAVGLRKPDACAFELACERLGVTVAETAFVGDDPIADVDGAAAAGLVAIHVPRDRRAPRRATAQATVHDLAELPAVIARWT